MSPESFAPCVLQVIPELETGGAERTTIDVAAALVSAGGRALVASQGGRLEGELSAAGASLYRMPAASKNPLTLIINMLRLIKIIRKEQVQIVHARSRAPAWSALWAARLTGRHFVTTYHGTYNAKGRAKRFYNSVMARGDVVIANSDFIARLVAQTYPQAEKRLRVIHRGSDITWLDPYEVSDARKEKLRTEWQLPDSSLPLVFLPGRMTWWKGQEVMIDAVQILKDRGQTDFVCVMVGDAQGRDDYVGGLKKSIRMKGLSDRVRLAGHCADMPAGLALADLVVSASIEPEAFGRIAVEAQAMGKPIIATDHGGSAETVLLGEGVATGWRVTPGDAAALADALEEALAAGPEVWQEMGRRGRANAEANFSVKQMCRKTIDVYREVAG
ncbi:MAG: glycosyltransferase [Alphaproteobacteria bacterium]|nr:MAG: glycosyltransferase [Alphaproteobacteria bacterium]